MNGSGLLNGPALIHWPRGDLTYRIICLGDSALGLLGGIFLQLFLGSLWTNLAILIPILVTYLCSFLPWALPWVYCFQFAAIWHRTTQIHQSRDLTYILSIQPLEYNLKPHTHTYALEIALGTQTFTPWDLPSTPWEPQNQTYALGGAMVTSFLQTLVGLSLVTYGTYASSLQTGVGITLVHSYLHPTAYTPFGLAFGTYALETPAYKLLWNLLGNLCIRPPPLDLYLLGKKYLPSDIPPHTWEFRITLSLIPTALGWASLWKIYASSTSSLGTSFNSAFLGGNFLLLWFLLWFLTSDLKTSLQSYFLGNLIPTALAGTCLWNLCLLPTPWDPSETLTWKPWKPKNHSSWNYPLTSLPQPSSILNLTHAAYDRTYTYPMTEPIHTLWPNLADLHLTTPLPYETPCLPPTGNKMVGH